MAELDAKILATIQDVDTPETEILGSKEVVFTVAEKITLMKAVLARPKPLNVQARPFQPQVPLPQPVIQIPAPANQPAIEQSPGEDHSLTEQPLQDGTETEPPGTHPPQGQGYSVC